MGIKMFKELTQLHGVSGYEREVSAYIKDKMDKYADDIKIDANGNLIAFKKGTGKNRKKLLFAAHMDEIGLQVIKIMDNGTIMIKQLGSCWIYTTYQSRVKFRNGVTGIVASRVQPEKISGAHTNLFVDIGVSSKKEAEKYVDIGDVCTYVGEYTELTPDYVTAKAIDDRIGCYAQMQALMDVKKPYNDVYLGFTVQEEVGTRGGGVVAHQVQPDFGIAMDVTPAHDRPGDLEGNNTLANGVAIKISDTASISSEDLVESAIAICKREKIKYQKDVIYVGGTDAAPISVTGDGVKTIGFSVTTRYTHGPNAIMSLSDMDNMIHLTREFMNYEFKF